MTALREPTCAEACAKLARNTMGASQTLAQGTRCTGESPVGQTGGKPSVKGQSTRSIERRGRLERLADTI